LGGVQLRIIFKCILDRQVKMTWTGLIWFRVGNSDGLFTYIRYRTLRFYKTRDNS
jgi:hypothetical protein